MLPDLTVSYSTAGNPTFGSGGGVSGAGRGGGRIVLHSYADDVIIAPGGVVRADGSGPTQYATVDGEDNPPALYGGGSGGSITVSAVNFTNSGLMSARGGYAFYRQGGAGGGGRISINVSATICYFMGLISR